MPSSENDKVALCEKILKDLDVIFKRNHQLDSFEIVPLESNSSNTSPVLHRANCLALEAWCIKYVYMHCYSELMDNYLYDKKRRSACVNSTNADSVRRLLNGALLINPDVNTFWNKRREMVDKDLLSFDDEFRFTRLVLTRKPKSNETFAYRKWLFERCLTDDPWELINSELALTSMCVGRCPTNYHAWSHRTWLVKKLQELPDFDIDSIHMQEYFFTNCWTADSVSDCSTFAYRQTCLINIFNLNADYYKNNFRKQFKCDFRLMELVANVDRRALPDEDEERIVFLLGKRHSMSDAARILRIVDVCALELSTNDQAITFYNSHEVLWNHRRFLILSLIRMMQSFFGAPGKHQAMETEHRYNQEMHNCLLFRAIKANEMRLMNATKNYDCFSSKYEKWLKFAVGFVY